ncbi:DUF4279 domain-containing protein [Undibacterium sp. Di24W]|uniref:DUF4279 domain-containing protein n=1 Tax=Undibacterium sp. Di24W TaxID=3413033 RepID=UPI003BF13514
MHDTKEPGNVSQILALEPTSSHIVGTRISERSDRIRRSSGWFLESAGHVESRDARHHLDWLLEKITGKELAFAELRNYGYEIDICCRWDSKSGHGGPTLNPKQMSVLSSLGIELWFDIYFDCEDSDV